MSRSGTDVAPHNLAPKRVRRGLFRWETICKACFVRPGDHPVNAWTPARPIGDTSPALPLEELRA